MSYYNLDVLRSRLNILDNSQDDLLTTSGDWADAAIDAYCHRWFESRRQTRYFGPDALDTSPLPFTPRGGLDYTDPLLRRVGWSQWPYRRLYMDADLITVYSITNGDGTSIPLGGFWEEPRNEIPRYSIWLKSDYSWVWDTDGWIAVDADWGYSVFPSPIISGCSYQLAEYHFRSRAPQSKQQPLWLNTQNKGDQMPEGFPTDVIKTLEPFIRLAR
jgi:hypothetical protein